MHVVSLRFFDFWFDIAVGCVIILQKCDFTKLNFFCIFAHSERPQVSRLPISASYWSELGTHLFHVRFRGYSSFLLRYLCLSLCLHHVVFSISWHFLFRPDGIKTLIYNNNYSVSPSYISAVTSHGNCIQGILLFYFYFILVIKIWWKNNRDKKELASKARYT